MTLLIFFSQYRLGCKYGLVFQMSIYNWIASTWCNNCQSGKAIKKTDSI